MKKSQNKAYHNQQQLSNDIQFLLSSIRARQNGLIFFLQHFSALHSDHKDEYRNYKNQFLQKQKIYTQQVEQTLSKYSKIAVDSTNHILRTFWLKLKSILKVSLQRIKILDLLNERIFQRYENMINLINKNYDQENGLTEFREIEDYLKKRNLDALVLGRNHLNSHPQGKILKNHSQTFIKLENQSNSECQNYFNPNIADNLQQPRMKSLNRIKSRKNDEKYGKITPSSKTCDRHYKKFVKNVEKYQKNIQSVMDGKIDIAFDRKKTIFDNVYTIYDSLFEKNIAVHKAISKFIYTSCGLKKILILKKSTQKKRGQKVKQKHNSKNKQRKRAETAELPKKFESLDENVLQNRNLKSSKGRKKFFILENSLPASKFINSKIA